MPAQPPAPMDQNNQRMVARILREHLRRGTMPPHWSEARLADACHRLGVTR